MAKNPQSKDESLEALDFIINVLKEHEKDLDKLISELATVTEQIGETGDLGGKVENLEEKIGSLQKEVSSMVNYIAGIGPKEATTQATVPAKEIQQTPSSALEVAANTPGGPSVVLRCKQWEDFQNLAFQAQTLSFNYKDEDKSFQADALKGNRIITYNGPLPKFSQIIKVWLSRGLGIPERDVLEGVLSIS